MPMPQSGAFIAIPLVQVLREYWVDFLDGRVALHQPQRASRQQRFCV